MASSLPPRATLSRRSLLAASAAGAAALLVGGCTSSPESADAEEEVTAAQADSLARQVPVQESLVAAYAAAAATDADVGQEVAPLAAQAEEQLTRLVAASPGTSGSTTAGSADPSATPTVGPDPRAWLVEQVTVAADSHAAACLEQSGARAALLGSLAAGLRGHAAGLA